MAAGSSEGSSALVVTGLKVEFRTREGTVRAVDGVSLRLDEGETLAIVGESGSGKTCCALSIMGLIVEPPGKVTAGEVKFHGADLLKLSDEQMRSIRGNRIAMIFQDPMSSLNPLLTVRTQIGELLQLHLGMDKAQAKQRCIELLQLVGIADAEQRLSSYPHELSGGMRQRVMIAMGLACNPQILIADEPTTALDVTIQAQIVGLVQRLRAENSMGIIWITHDLGVVAGVADRVMVMYAGHVVEEATVDDLFAAPQHPYTIALLESSPRVDGNRAEKLRAIQGSPPDLANLPPGCPFERRCTRAVERCRQDKPVLEQFGERHHVACWQVSRSMPNGSRIDADPIRS